MLCCATERGGIYEFLYFRSIILERLIPSKYVSHNEKNHLKIVFMHFRMSHTVNFTKREKLMFL